MWFMNYEIYEIYDMKFTIYEIYNFWDLWKPIYRMIFKHIGYGKKIKKLLTTLIIYLFFLV